MGDKIMTLPGGQESEIVSIDVYGKELTQAVASQSVTIRIKDDIDISRGDMLVRPDNQPMIGQELEVMICWFNSNPLTPGGKYILRHTTNEVRCLIKEVEYKMDINSLEMNRTDRNIGMNDIGKLRIKTTQPLFFDPYTRNRITGSVIFIDEGTHETMAAGMIT